MEITFIFRQNRRMIEFCGLLVSFRSIVRRALCSRAKFSNLGLQTSKYLNRDGNYFHFSSKSTNDRGLRVVGLLSKHSTACTMFCAQNAVISAFKCRNISIGKEITVIFRQKRRMIEFCGLLGLFRSIVRRALCSRAKFSNLGLQTSKYLNRNGNYVHFSSKSTNDRVLRVVGLLSKHSTACTMFSRKIQ
jgi:hypothetical protein